MQIPMIMKNENKSSPDKENEMDQALNKRQAMVLLIHRVLVVLLVVTVSFLLGVIYKPKVNMLSERVALKQSINLPHYIEVMSAIGQLSYSGLQTLVKPNVNLTIDFGQKSWTLSNIHQLDSQGQVLLEQGRYGLCGQLADYVYRQVKPIFGNQYDYSFWRVAEMGYFLNMRSSHIVLQIKSRKAPHETFVIDPSLPRYDLMDNFDNYNFHSNMDHLTFPKDVTFGVSEATPVVIKKGFILDLAVEAADDVFDRNNFVIALSATKQYSFTGRYLFGLRLRNGIIQKFENLPLVDWLLGREDYYKLRTKIIDWFIKNTEADADPQNKQAVEDLLRIAKS